MLKYTREESDSRNSKENEKLTTGILTNEVRQMKAKIPQRSWKKSENFYPMPEESKNSLVRMSWKKHDLKKE